MNEPIKVGDMVIVAKPTICCGSTRSIGKIGVVREINSAPSHCPTCGTVIRGVPVALVHPQQKWGELVRLKRIPPLDELEGEKRREELTA